MRYAVGKVGSERNSPPAPRLGVLRFVNQINEPRSSTFPALGNGDVGAMPVCSKFDSLKLTVMKRRARTTTNKHPRA